MVRDSGQLDPVVTEATQHEVQDLPEDVLVFLLGSRYCETDHLSETAWRLFGRTPLGWARVQAICDFVHTRIAFDYADARPRGPRGKPSTKGAASAATSHISRWRCAGA